MTKSTISAKRVCLKIPQRFFFAETKAPQGASRQKGALQNQQMKTTASKGPSQKTAHKLSRGPFQNVTSPKSIHFCDKMKE